MRVACVLMVARDLAGQEGLDLFRALADAGRCRRAPLTAESFAKTAMGSSGKTGSHAGGKAEPRFHRFSRIQESNKKIEETARIIS